MMLADGGGRVTVGGGGRRAVAACGALPRVKLGGAGTSSATQRRKKHTAKHRSKPPQPGATPGAGGECAARVGGSVRSRAKPGPTHRTYAQLSPEWCAASISRQKGAVRRPITDELHKTPRSPTRAVLKRQACAPGPSRQQCQADDAKTMRHEMSNSSANRSNAIRSPGPLRTKPFVQRCSAAQHAQKLGTTCQRTGAQPSYRHTTSHERAGAAAVGTFTEGQPTNGGPP